MEITIQAVTINTTVSILFKSKDSQSHTICKVSLRKMNWKLRKLQDEGMYIVGVVIEEVKDIDNGS
jgi:hypothetical protein